MGNWHDLWQGLVNCVVWTYYFSKRQGRLFFFSCSDLEPIIALPNIGVYYRSDHSPVNVTIPLSLLNTYLRRRGT